MYQPDNQSPGVANTKFNQPDVAMLTMLMPVCTINMSTTSTTTTTCATSQTSHKGVRLAQP